MISLYGMVEMYLKRGARAAIPREIRDQRSEVRGQRSEVQLSRLSVNGLQSKLVGQALSPRRRLRAGGSLAGMADRLPARSAYRSERMPALQRSARSHRRLKPPLKECFEQGSQTEFLQAISETRRL